MAKKILEKFPQLTADDVRSVSSGAGGEDVLLSQAAKRAFSFAIECKSHASFAVYKHYEQAKSHVRGSELPLLVIKQNRSEPLVCLSLDHFLEVYARTPSNKNK